ncbi:hypothetical protein T440DRAFT_499701 [Plenodomus tracheiphilus IPT5]|uniref:Uncharacterized protein n=1 Tax=Plenodomus tracheiphilus IPT5 TaxID=1408161 RepID=A0A6A7B2I3_9PLEO|nr:hypothetical protein T440DRAFT_499701 [Plenodomus tracheiphilus IPT5]
MSAAFMSMLQNMQPRSNRSLQDLIDSNDQLTGMDALELRGWASNNPLIPTRDLTDPLGKVLLSTVNGNWDALQNYINSRKASLGDDEAATEIVQDELYAARWGPTRLPIYNVILQFFFFAPENESKLLNLTRYLTTTIRVPIDATDATGATALYWSISTKPFAVPTFAQLLFSAGGSVNTRNRFGGTTGSEIAQADVHGDTSKNVEMMRWFVQHGGDVHAKDNDGMNVRMLVDMMKKKVPGMNEVLEQGRGERKEGECENCGREGGLKKLTYSNLSKMRLNPDNDSSSFPKRADLPHISGTPEGAAWFWGGSDELGRLNLLTNERIAKATRENVQTGEVVPLDLPLNIPGPTFFGRKPMKHRIKSIGKGAFDDEIEINTQSSSQWDGFRHFADPKSGAHYNGCFSDVIMAEIAEADDNESEATPEEEDKPRRLGIDAWAKRGIVGRGVLLDIYAWAQANGTHYNPFTTHYITTSDLLACAKAQNTTFQAGDILLIRTGWLSHYFSLTPSQKATQSKLNLDAHAYAGLEASDAMKDFLHDNYFAAAVCDNANFEAWPPPSLQESLHACLLPLWGMPIGELWDLERLGRVCKEKERWTFLVTSAPGNVPGGVGSPPNALALF